MAPETYYAIHHTAFVLMTIMRISALFNWIEIEYLVRAHRYRLSLTCKWLELSLPGTKCLEAGPSSGLVPKIHIATPNLGEAGERPGDETYGRIICLNLLHWIGVDLSSNHMIDDRGD